MAQANAFMGYDDSILVTPMIRNKCIPDTRNVVKSIFLDASIGSGDVSGLTPHNLGSGVGSFLGEGISMHFGNGPVAGSSFMLACG